MRARRAAWIMALVALLSATLWAQAPRLVRYGGVLRDPFGAPRTGTALLTLSLYDDADSSVPLFVETQLVTLDADGRYSVLLGATRPEGLPLDIFSSGEARWLGVQVDGAAEGTRIALLAVPYALKAADADTVGGKPASAFLLAGAPTSGSAVASATASITPLATSGTAGFLGVFTTSTDLGNSVVFQSAQARVGVNTVSPAAPFHSAASETPGAFFDVYSDFLGALPLVFRAARGTQGVPTAVQTDDILGGLAVRGYATSGFTPGKGQVMFKAAENWTDAANGTYLQFTTTPIGQTAFAERMRIDPFGRVGVGTSAPTALLHVAGDAVVDGNIAAKYQDVAEWVESRQPLEPGTVVVVDAAAVDGVRPSTRAYDSAVAGAVSAQPGVVLGEAGPTKSLVAQSGRVRIKVDARFGAIRPGDLLVSSPTPGHAMISRPVRIKGVALHRPGTILGKALEPHASGRGEILVLLTLQ